MSSSSSTTSLPSGTIIGDGRYKVLRELNRGGTAVVYEGINIKNTNKRERVALKVMSVKDGKATVPIKGVRREIEYAVSVAHENIVKLLDFIVEERHIVIVWELIEGSDLLDLLNERGGRLDESTAAFFFVQLLQGVRFIHANGLCHRDLKPENCMVERATRRLKIIDFGLSKHQQSAVTLGVGTPDYMAPELLGRSDGEFGALHERQVGHYDARACDVWAMGVLLYLIVTGQYPFEDPKQPQNVVATLQNISSGRMRPFPAKCRLSDNLIDLIKRMLTIDSKQRITLHGIAEHPWLSHYNNIINNNNSSQKNEKNEVKNTVEAFIPTVNKHVEEEKKKKEVVVMADAIAATAEPAPRQGTFTFPSLLKDKNDGSAVQTKQTPATPKVIHQADNRSKTKKDNAEEKGMKNCCSENCASTPSTMGWLGGLCKQWFGA